MSASRQISLCERFKARLVMLRRFDMASPLDGPVSSIGMVEAPATSILIDIIFLPFVDSSNIL